MKNFVVKVLGPTRIKGGPQNAGANTGAEKIAGTIKGGRAISRLVTTGTMKPLLEPAPATLPVVRKMTMPGGEKITVMRDDVFNKAIRRHKPDAG